MNKLLGYAFAGSEFVFGESCAKAAFVVRLAFFHRLSGATHASSLSPRLFAECALPPRASCRSVILRFRTGACSETMGISGAESRANVAASMAAAGQTEAPLSIRHVPCQPRTGSPELMTVMTSGMAHVSGGIMAAYILVGASTRCRPARFACPSADRTRHDSRLKDAGARDRYTRHPRTRASSAGRRASRGKPDRRGGTRHYRWRPPRFQRRHHAHLLRRTHCTRQRHLRRRAANWLIPHHIPFPTSTIRSSAGSSHPSRMADRYPGMRKTCSVGNLLAHPHGYQRTHCVHQPGRDESSLDPRSFTIATFALCGFANLSSIGIQIGGIGALIPERPQRACAPRSPRHARRAPMANLMSASIVGVLLQYVREQHGASEDDLERIARQSAELQRASFNEDDAWQLGVHSARTRG